MDGFRSMIKGWLGKTLLVLFMVPFAFVGLESYFGGGGRVVVAKVNGEKLYQNEVDMVVERQRQRLMEEAAQAGRSASDIDVAKLRKSVLDDLVTRLLLTQESERIGYLVSDASVFRMIREVPAFQEDGKFSQARYEMMLRQIGESPATYPAKARQELAYSMLIAGMGQSGFLTRTELERLSALESQRRDIHFASIPAARFLDQVAVTDDEVKAFYEANPKRFTTEETVALDYLTLRRDDLLPRIQVSEDELQERYQEKLKELAADEQRQAQHILLKADGGSDDELLKKMKAVEQRARAGEDFGKLAREFSQDEGSVAGGGDLGLAGRGQFVPEFEAALFGLKPGEISAPVKTEFGYHLIKLNRIQKTDAPSFASLRATLETEVRQAKVEELFVEQTDKLDAAVYESSDLQEPARTAGLPLASTAPFTARGGDGIAADRKVVDAAFSDDLIKDGKSSQGIHMNDGSVVWVRVREHKPAALRPLEQLTAEIRNQLMIDKARAQSQQVAEAAAKAVADGTPMAEVAVAHNLKWVDLPDADRRTQMPGLELLRTAFHLPHPAAGKVSVQAVEMGSGYGLVAVSKVSSGVANSDSISQMRGVLSESRSQQEFQDYVQYLRAAGKVRTYLKEEARDE